MNICAKITFLLIAAFLAAAAHAETYQYQGEDGAVVFTDDASKIPKKKGKVRTIPEDTAVSYARPAERSPAAYRATGPSSRASSPKILRQDSSFEVGGYNFREIRREIWRRSPYWAIGNKAANGWCSWNVLWTINTRKDGNLCRIESVATTVPISITMAHWKNYASADAGMKEAWDIFYKGVLEHEERHASHGIGAAHDIERRLPELPARYSCKDLTDEAGLLARRIVTEHREEDMELDRREGTDFDIMTDVDMAADKREGIVGRQYFQRKDGRQP